jgi:hypothetical protein
LDKPAHDQRRFVSAEHRVPQGKFLVAARRTVIEGETGSSWVVGCPPLRPLSNRRPVSRIDLVFILPTEPGDHELGGIGDQVPQIVRARFLKVRLGLDEFVDALWPGDLGYWSTSRFLLPGHLHRGTSQPPAAFSWDF